MGNVSSSNGLDKLVPKLRFPQFRDEWIEKSLSELLDFQNGINADSSQYGHGIKYISVMDILNNDYITYSNIRGMVDIDEKTLNHYSVEYGDIVFQRSSETMEDVGNTNVYLDKEKVATFGGFVIRGKKKSDYEPFFLKNLLCSPPSRKKIVCMGAGSQHFNIGQDSLSKIVIPLPSITEQQKISSFLSLLDKRITKQRELVESLKSYKRGVNLYLLSKFSEYTTLDKLCSIVGGGTPDTSNTEYWNGDVQWFTPSEIGKQKYVISSERTISNSGLNNSSAKLLPIDTVLLTTRATLGEMSISQCQCTTNQGFQSLIPNANAKSEYLYYLQVIIKPWCEKYASGNTFREISKKNLSKCLVPSLSDKEQEKFISILRAIDGSINRNEAVLDNLTTMKNALLKQLFI